MDLKNRPDPYSKHYSREGYFPSQLPRQGHPPPPLPHQHLSRPPPSHPHFARLTQHAPHISNNRTNPNNQPSQPPHIRPAPHHPPSIIYPQASQGQIPPPPPPTGGYPFPEPHPGRSRPYEEPMNSTRAVAPSQFGANVMMYGAQMHVMPKVNSAHPHVSYPQPTTHVAQVGMVRPPAAKAARNAHTPHNNRFLEGMSKEQFVENAGSDLDGRAGRNEGKFQLPAYSEPESVFFSVVKPEIPTKEYLKRLVTYTHCSPAAFIVMLIYLERVAAKQPRLIVTLFNMHRLLITALTLACKNLDDQCFANAHYAKVGGIPTVREMNRLELQLLKYLERLFVTEEEYKRKLRQLSGTQNHTGGYDGKGHGQMKGGMGLYSNSSPVSITEQMFAQGGNGVNAIKMSERKGMDGKGNMRRAAIQSQAKCDVMVEKRYYADMYGGGQCETTKITQGMREGVVGDRRRVTEAYGGGHMDGLESNGVYGGVQRGMMHGGRGGEVEVMDVCRKGT